MLWQWKPLQQLQKLQVLLLELLGVALGVWLRLLLLRLHLRMRHRLGAVMRALPLRLPPLC